MYTNKYLMILLGLITMVFWGFSSAQAWAPDYMATTDPGNTQPPNAPWQAPGPVSLAMGDTVWYSSTNYYVSYNTKGVTFTWNHPNAWRMTAIDGKGYYNGGASQSALIGGVINNRPSNDSLIVTFVLDPQPDWEVVVLQRTAKGNSDGLVILDFEDVPEEYWYFGGNQNLDGFYPGLYFGPAAVILENLVYGYNDTGYPPHSGHQVLASIDESFVQVNFDNPTDHVGLWYTSYYDFYLEAYDAGGTLIASAQGPSNYTYSDYIEVNADGIAYVIYHNSGDFFVIDDFEYNEPEQEEEFGGQEYTWSNCDDGEIEFGLGKGPMVSFIGNYDQGPDDVINLTELIIFPEEVEVDPGIPPELDAPTGTGPWYSEFVYYDPRGNPRPLGGVRWYSTGPGIEAFTEYDMRFSIQYMVDQEFFNYFVFDTESDAYHEFRLYADAGECVCNIWMVPDDDPVVVPPGGRFGVTGHIENPCNETIVTDIWGGVWGFGNFYQQFSFANRPINPGQHISAHMWQNVPGYAPQGTYQYCCYCGDRPSVKDDSFCFPFTVTGVRTADGANEWMLEGGFDSAEVPGEYALIGSFPNPFNATTTITYELPEAGNVALEVYNIMGQKVATLVDGNMDAGQHSVVWDASSQSSGIYFYKLTAGGKALTKRMTLLK
ncbi:MAG: T9SS type A sorting domain-containing protein [candidate division Zixibacteria bacterium]|nr:T9SS type A sorting domain-containing protein [candidate division Zixibacteria bacterium]